MDSGQAGLSEARHFFTESISVSELHKFIFEGLPVRGSIVRLTDAWQEILQRRAGNGETGAYPAAVRELLGEMAAAGVLMQSNIKFNGALVFVGLNALVACFCYLVVVGEIRRVELKAH